MSAAATRFYRRSHEKSTQNPRAPRPVDSDLATNRHRYSVPYRYLKDNPGKTVCELGYGGPGIIPLLASNSDQYHIIDIVDRLNGDHLPGNVYATVGNLDEHFPFKDEIFDVVVALMVIEHLYDPFHSFAELSRILKVGGIGFVNLPNIASIRCRLSLLQGKMPVTSSNDWFEKREWDGNHLHYFTISDVTRLGGLFGLKLIDFQPVGKFLWLKRIRPSLFCHEITYIFQKC